MKTLIKKINKLSFLFICIIFTPTVHVQGSNEEEKDYGWIGWVAKKAVGEDGIKNIEFKPVIDGCTNLIGMATEIHDIYFGLDPKDDPTMTTETKQAAEARRSKIKEKLEKLDLKSNIKDLKEFFKEHTKDALESFEGLNIKKRYAEDVAPTLWWIKVAAGSIFVYMVGKITKAAYELLKKRRPQRALPKKSKTKRAKRSK